MTKRTFKIQPPTDGNGFVGRQCTKNDCNKYLQDQAWNGPFGACNSVRYDKRADVHEALLSLGCALIAGDLCERSG